MSNIFEYRGRTTDGYLRRMEVRTGLGRDTVVFDTAPNEETPAAVLSARDVRELHFALGAWLNENGITAERTPEPTSDEYERVTADDVRRIVADELTKREALWGDYAREVARQQLRNFLTRAIEMGADR